MARTEVRGGQIKDTSVSRADLDTSTIGEAVVRRIIAGTNITLGSTGADTGTGDVTVNTTANVVGAASSTDNAVPRFDLTTGKLIQGSGVIIDDSNNIAVGLGAAGTPGYSFIGDLDTGFWSPSADTLAWATGGTERMRIDSSGRILIGRTTSNLGTNFQVETSMEVTRSGDLSYQLPSIEFIRSRGTTASPTDTANGDTVGEFGFRYRTGGVITYAGSFGAVRPASGAGCDIYFQPNGVEALRLNVSTAHTITGGLTVSSYIKSSNATTGVGYATGAGGTVTQATSKSTGVTLNKVTGQITMNSASLAATTSVAFTLTNSAIAATDVIIVNISSTLYTTGYFVEVSTVASGSCVIHLRNIGASALSEPLVLNFAVIKGVTS